MSIRDDFWLWGQVPNSHHEEGNNIYNLPGVNKMTPIEGAKFFGIKNICMVVMEDKPAVEEFPQMADELSSIDKVVWSVFGNGGSKRTSDGGSDIAPMLEVAKSHPNIIAGVADDFMNDARMKIYTPEIINGYKERLHNEIGRKLDFWAVLYAHELADKIKPYLDVFDVITFWNWRADSLSALDENLERLKGLAGEDKPIYAGCYMWDYGNHKPMPMELMKMQLEKYLEWYNEGKIKGVILCSNCIADIGLDTVDYTREWLLKH